MRKNGRKRRKRREISRTSRKHPPRALEVCGSWEPWTLRQSDKGDGTWKRIKEQRRRGRQQRSMCSRVDPEGWLQSRLIGRRVALLFGLLPRSHPRQKRIWPRSNG